jgi:hypothetical protein
MRDEQRQTAEIFVGWVRRPGRSWCRLGTASTVEDAWLLLRKRAGQLGYLCVDFAVTREGNYPDWSESAARGDRQAVERPGQRRCF